MDRGYVQNSSQSDQSVSTIEMAPHCSQKLHIVRWPLSPEAQATRSFGICEQFELEKGVMISDLTNSNSV